MDLPVGTRLGRYKIISAIGKGGMGEVYKAEDDRLNRTVAIKVLPQHLAKSFERRARIEREAKVISQLNHPNICTLHDVGEDNGTDYLIMEYIDGETLAERLRKGALKIDDTLDFGIQIARGLAAAHGARVVHRDLKPANIMLTKSGVKLLDFGLAKVLEWPEASGPDVPTRERALTEEHDLVGTLPYMAPEQLEAKAVDSRTDIWALGVVLYEMLVGKKAFESETQAGLITSILATEPLPISAPSGAALRRVDHVVRRCLAKSPDDRWQAVSDVRHELRWILDDAQEDHLPDDEARFRDSRLLHFIGGGLLVGTLVWSLGREVPDPRPVRQAAIQLAEGNSYAAGNVPNLALSPDGDRIVYAATGAELRRMLYVRPMSETRAYPIPGTDDGIGPFFSPDGQWIGFTGPGGIQIVALSGGAPITLQGISPFRGASWTEEDTIIFAPGNQTGLWRMSADGGEATELTRPDRERGEKSHRLPQVLPGGKAIVFTIGMDDETLFDDGEIAVFSLETGDYQVLIEGGQQARYVSSGHLVYARGHTLLAIPFDLQSLAVTGAPTPVQSNVSVSPIFGNAEFTVSTDGTLAFLSGLSRGVDRSIVFVDREGNAQTSDAFERAGFSRVSPSGDRLVVNSQGANDDLWIYDLAKSSRTRITSRWSNYEPVWHPDGDKIAFVSSRNGSADVYSMAADGSGGVELLVERARPTSWGPDGALIYNVRDQETGLDIWALSADRVEARPLIRDKFNERMGEVSPDGRRLAYVSDESGRDEVYVQRFPNLGGKTPISIDGGSAPVWARSGRELFFVSDAWMNTVAVTAQGDFSAPRRLFPLTADQVLHDDVRREFDVSADGQHFVIVERGDSESPTSDIQVIFNWTEKLRRRLHSSN